MNCKSDSSGVNVYGSGGSNHKLSGEIWNSLGSKPRLLHSPVITGKERDAKNTRNRLAER